MIDTTCKLQPDGLLELARKYDCARFTEAVGAPILLVRIDDVAGGLLAGLAEGSTQGGARIEATMGFETVGAGHRPAAFALPRSAPPFGSAQLRVRLHRALHVAVPLRKRADAGKAFIERISVGRARNNDVVLRHESVSKCHAWFRCDDSGAFYVGDAMSRNGTYVHDLVIQPSVSVPVPPGAILRFGIVEAIVSPPGVLWDALHARG